MSGSTWVITPSWLSGSWNLFCIVLLCIVATSSQYLLLLLKTVIITTIPTSQAFWEQFRRCCLQSAKHLCHVHTACSPSAHLTAVFASQHLVCYLLPGRSWIDFNPKAFPSLWLPALAHIPRYGHKVAAYPFIEEVSLSAVRYDALFGDTEMGLFVFFLVTEGTGMDWKSSQAPA